MFGSSTSPTTSKDDETAVDTNSATDDTKPTTAPIPINTSNGPEKRESEDSPASAGPKMTEDSSSDPTRKRRTSGVRAMFSDAKNSLREMGSSPKSPESKAQTPIQKLAKTDAALGVAQGSLNNSAGESAPGPRSTFRVGVTEDKNKKCRRTMEDTHAYLYNFLSTPAPLIGADAPQKNRASTDEASANRSLTDQIVETDNGYFAIFDGHAGTFAADWCGKKLHLLLEDTIRRNPNTPIPELLDQTFTLVDQQLEKLPLKNSGCTAVIAVLRWEDRVPNSHSATGSAFLGSAAAAAAKAANDTSSSTADATQAAQNDITPTDNSAEHAPEARLRQAASRQRVLYTANVGDARIVLCRNGRALRLSYDHKGSDENEGRRVSNAGGLILNNRVNGVLAVTRALGDSYMKDLVTGHPYTTETVIQPDQDEFLILACDGLWDVCSDQEAVDLVRSVHDPQAASKTLVDHALARFSTDNLSCMIVRFNNEALKVQKTESAVGVDSDRVASQTGVSEATAIVEQSKKNLTATGELNENISADSIMEEEAEDQEPGPELNADALKAKQVNHA